MSRWADHTLLLALLGVVACGGRAGDSASVGDSGAPVDGGAAGDGGADGGAADGGATDDCVLVDDPAAVFGQVQAALAETIPTVVNVSWQPQLEGTGFVRFWTASLPAVDAPARSIGSGESVATLVGVPADTEVSFQVGVDTGDGTRCAPVQTIRTGALPAGLPSLTVSTSLPAAAAGGYTLLPLSDVSGGGAPPWLTIVDPDGQPVWFVDASTVRMRLSLDGQAVLYNDLVQDPAQDGSITRVSLDGSDRQQIVVEGGHFDFVEVSDGVYATFDWDVREVEGGALVAGERIVEATASGDEQVIWSVWDAAVPDLDNIHPPNDLWSIDAYDWSHLNHLFYDADEDAYYVTARNIGLTFKVSRATGETLWTLGRTSEDFAAVVEGGIEFNPHSAVPTDRGVLLFDTDSPLSEGCSALSEFALDTDVWTAEQVWLYHTDDCLVSSYLGNAVELPGGNRLMVLAMNAQIDEVTPDLELAWRLNAPAGWMLGYGDRIDGFYPGR